MTLSRRDFIRRTSLALAGGLIVGDQALELLERLTHRKVWALGAMPSVLDLDLRGATAGTLSFIIEEDAYAIGTVRINGQRADMVTELGVGPNGRRMFRASRYLGPGTIQAVDGRALRSSVQPIHAGLEDGSWPTSPIVTYDKPVTRPADRISYDWKTGEMTHHTPLRFVERDGLKMLLRESEATNYLTHSGDPRRRA